VLFDFDGTLAPSLPLWLKAYQIALAKFAIAISDDEVLRRCFFRDWAEVAAEFGVCTGEQMRIEVGHGLQEAFASAVLFPQARALIEHCRAHGLQTALVTSAPRELIASVAMRLDIEHLFDFVICGDEVANYKPHPEPVLTTLRALGCEAAHAIMIGDSHADVLAGKAAGTRTALFMPDDHHRFHDPERLRASAPDFIFVDHGELPGLLGLGPLSKAYR
jgi:phosphoglycolate phosphatase/pyrophosphatase PpaX